MKITKAERELLALDEVHVTGAARALFNFEHETRPSGRSDNGGRWYPHADCDCCRGIRSPSRTWPWSLYVHAHSLEHRAQEEGSNLDAARAVRTSLKSTGIEIDKLSKPEELIQVVQNLRQAAGAKLQATQLQSLAKAAAAQCRLASAQVRAAKANRVLSAHQSAQAERPVHASRPSL